MQSFSHWLQSPQQGAIATPTDWRKEQIADDLSTALPFLQNAYDAAEKAGFNQSNYECLQALGDALTACTEALERLDDAPDA